MPADQPIGTYPVAFTEFYRAHVDEVTRLVARRVADPQLVAAPVHLGAEPATIELPGGVRPNIGPAVAVSPQGDAIYVAVPAHKPGSAHSDIVVTQSRDSGRTWSKPMKHRV
jgi:hypothetical protein